MLPPGSSSSIEGSRMDSSRSTDCWSCRNTPAIYTASPNWQLSDWPYNLRTLQMRSLKTLHYLCTASVHLSMAAAFSAVIHGCNAITCMPADTYASTSQVTAKSMYCRLMMIICMCWYIIYLWARVCCALSRSPPMIVASPGQCCASFEQAVILCPFSTPCC